MPNKPRDGAIVWTATSLVTKGSILSSLEKYPITPCDTRIVPEPRANGSNFRLAVTDQCTFPVLARPDLVGSGRMVGYSSPTVSQITRPRNFTIGGYSGATSKRATRPQARSLSDLSRSCLYPHAIHNFDSRKSVANQRFYPVNTFNDR